MAGLTKQQDAYGAAMWDALNDPEAACVIEREDGFVDVDLVRSYLRPYPEWSDSERQAIALARGRVLDVGCGPGRVALYLQGRRMKAVGLDNSPLALTASQRRGLRQTRLMSVTRASRKTLGIFDTIIMLGNNFGLMGNFSRARMLLRRFHAMTPPSGRIIAESNDVRNTTRSEHLAYQRSNLRRGRMAGQIRFRIRYRNLCTPYMDYLMVSKNEMSEIATGTGWRIAKSFDSAGSTYIAVMEKETAT